MLDGPSWKNIYRHELGGATCGKYTGNRHVPTMQSFYFFNFLNPPVYNLGFDSIRNQKNNSLMLNCPFETKNNTLNTPMYILFLAFQFSPYCTASECRVTENTATDRHL